MSKEINIMLMFFIIFYQFYAYLQNYVTNTALEKNFSIGYTIPQSNISIILYNESLKNNFAVKKPTAKNKHKKSAKYYTVYIYHGGKRCDILNVLCNGILISKQWILTSSVCNVTTDLTVLVGVRRLPAWIQNENKYKIKKIVHSIKEKVLIAMLNRQVHKNYAYMPKIRLLEKSEIYEVLGEKNCKTLAWNVDFYQKLSQSSVYIFNSSNKNNLRIGGLNAAEVSVMISDTFFVCKRDVGSPIICNGVLSAIILDVEEECGFLFTVKFLCPLVNWTNFFILDESFDKYDSFQDKNNVHSLSKSYFLSAICILYYVFGLN